jgi:hypothetical protein
MTPSLHMSESLAAEPSVPCEEAFAQRRFLAVHFTNWRLDASRSMLRRALRRASDAASHQVGHVEGHVEGHFEGHVEGHIRESVGTPFLLVEEQRGIAQVVAACAQCKRHGVREGITLAQAESMCPPFQPSSSARDVFAELCAMHGVGSGVGSGAGSEPWWSRCVSWGGCALVMRADRARESRMLVRLAHCLERWIPRIALVGPSGDAGDPSVLTVGLVHGKPAEQRLGASTSCAVSSREYASCGHASLESACLVGDLTGCQRLFRKEHGTEQALLRRIMESFHAKGFRVRVATASTIGMSVAAARHGARPSRGTKSHLSASVREGVFAVPARREEEHLDPLPIASLRIPAVAVAALESVGVRTVGQLSQLRREGVAARFGGDAASVAPQRRRAVRGGRRHVASPARWEAEAGLFQGMVGSAEDANPSSPARGARSKRCGSSSSMTPDVLRRLDQALGLVPEELVPLRSCEEIVLRREFDGPVARLETILAACGELVDRLSRHLHERREALRSARWVFRHAELPADLSTDALQVHRSSEGCSRSGSIAGFESIVMLELSCPSARRTLLWRLLHPRIERLALDHGVEEISCRLEDAVRLRCRQRQLLTRADPPPQLSSQRPATAQAVRQGSAAACAGPIVGMESELTAGWVEIGSRGKAGVAPDDTGRLHAQTQQWIDLLASRGARASIGRHACRDGLRAAWPPRAVASRAGASCVRLYLERPTVEFDPPEPAFLSGGDASVELAQCVAQRTAWRGPCGNPMVAPHAQGRIGAGSAMASEATCTATPPPSVHWRSRTWRLRALDGWERIAAPWWIRADAHVDACGRQAEAGRFYGRLRIGGGLWVFVRWPEALRCRSASAQPAPHATGHMVVPPWIARSAEAIRRGVELEVLGAWG